MSIPEWPAIGQFTQRFERKGRTERGLKGQDSMGNREEGEGEREQRRGKRERENKKGKKMESENGGKRVICLLWRTRERSEGESTMEKKDVSGRVAEMIGRER